MEENSDQPPVQATAPASTPSEPPAAPPPQSPETPPPPNPAPPPTVASEPDKKTSWAKIILSTFFILALAATGIFGYNYYRSSQQPAITAVPTPTQVTQTPANTELETYSNTKLGYTIKYPKSLNIKVIEADPKAENREYIRKCESGEIEGCGGARSPDFRTDFKQGNVPLFSVSVYQQQVLDSGLGDILRDTFTYAVSRSTTTENLSPEELSGAITNATNVESLSIEEINFLTKENLLSQLEFIEPDAPLLCLWDVELGPGFDPEEDKEYIEEHKEDLYLHSGYYVSPLSESCESTSFYSWDTQLEKDKPPFTTENDCLNTCFN